MKRIDEAIKELSAPASPVAAAEPAYDEEFPRWYFLDTGVLLRRAREVEVKADIEGRDKNEALADWIKTLALELACQLDNPSAPAAPSFLETTKRRMRRYSHPGNASGKRGGARPRSGPKKQKEV